MVSSMKRYKNAWDFLIMRRKKKMLKMSKVRLLSLSKKSFVKFRSGFDFWKSFKIWGFTFTGLVMYPSFSFVSETPSMKRCSQISIVRSWKCRQKLFFVVRYFCKEIIVVWWRDMIWNSTRLSHYMQFWFSFQNGRWPLQKFRTNICTYQVLCHGSRIYYPEIRITLIYCKIVRLISFLVRKFKYVHIFQKENLDHFKQYSKSHFSLSKNSNLTNPQHFHEFFTQIFFGNFSREIKVVNS